MLNMKPGMRHSYLYLKKLSKWFTLMLENCWFVLWIKEYYGLRRPILWVERFICEPWLPSFLELSQYGSLLFVKDLLLLSKLVAQMVKNPPANAGDAGLISGSGRSLGEGNGNLLQHSCLEDSMDRGAWQATVFRVADSWTQLSDWAHVCILLLGRWSIACIHNRRNCSVRGQ